ncbi:SET domain-containing 5 [Pyrenophora seminiperda CCB06]|uniref:SET domain-containing 5 n=1 Tax=Pyrenophora seminiperda CCB06 TaxID=1302712 RepID=A0A3M7MBN7_9PLEO|nr:SET domain-containing 5 [Pyrenophora seminiperda CCB06]
MLPYIVFILPLLPLSAVAHSPTCSAGPISSQLQQPICQGPPDVYVVETSQGKGLGVFATHDMEIGDIVMREAPILKIQFPPVAKGGAYPTEVVSRLVHDEFEALSPAEKDEVLSLTYYTKAGNTTEVDKVATIFRTNAYNTGDKVGLFPKIARINHSCRPNTGYSWSERLNKRVVFATRKIKAGEEFFVSYISLTMTQEDRQKHLDKYGFKCQCDACAQEHAARAASDKRRTTINNAFVKFEHRLIITPPESKAGKREALVNAQVSIQLAQLVQEEGLADYYAKTYRIVAITHGRTEDWQNAAIWANKAYEIRFMEDPDSSLTTEMEQLTSLYIANWENQLRNAAGASA